MATQIDARVFLALHEERYPCAVFSTMIAAQQWVQSRPEPDYTFTIEEFTIKQ